LSKKRGNGEGSIHRRKGGGWCAQYTVYTAKGRKRKTLYGRTRAEVAAKLSKALSERESGIHFDAGNLTLEDYLDRWLIVSVQDTVRQRTWERYEQIARLHIKPALGKLRLKALTPTHVRSLYREKLDTGLATRTVQYIHTTLHKALKDAVADALVPRNVTEGIKAPRPKRKEVNALSADQVQMFLSMARGDRFEALYIVAVHCGLREGELLGLRWEDIDLDTGTLAVRRTLSETKSSGHIFEPPKNEKGRNVRLTNSAIEALKRHRAAQNEERLRLGTLWQDQGLVFPSRKGTTMNAKNLTSRSFKPILEQAGLPNIRLHDLRHTCATLLLSRGVHPKLVQELLGHATISITLDTYSHVLPSMGDQTVTAMESVLS
jgi:integrase